MTSAAVTRAATGRVLVGFRPDRIVPFRFVQFGREEMAKVTVSTVGVEPHDLWMMFGTETHHRHPDLMVLKLDKSTRAEDAAFFEKYAKGMGERFPSLEDVYGPDQFHLESKEAIEHNRCALVLWYHGQALDDKGTSFEHSFFRVQPNCKVFYAPNRDNASGELKRTVGQELLELLQLVQLASFAQVNDMKAAWENEARYHNLTSQGIVVVASTDFTSENTATLQRDPRAVFHVMVPDPLAPLRGHPEAMAILDDEMEPPVFVDATEEAKVAAQAGARIRDIHVGPTNEAWSPTTEQLESIAKVFAGEDP